MIRSTTASMAESNPFGALHSLTLHGSGWTILAEEANPRIARGAGDRCRFAFRCTLPPKKSENPRGLRRRGRPNSARSMHPPRRRGLIPICNNGRSSATRDHCSQEFNFIALDTSIGEKPTPEFSFETSWTSMSLASVSGSPPRTEEQLIAER